MIIFTTSRHPTQRLRSFIREFSQVVNNSLMLTRGKANLRDLDDTSTEFKADKLVIASRWHGGPGRLEFKKLSNRRLRSIPPLIYLLSVRLKREHGIRGRFSIECITTEEDRRLSRLAFALSEFLELPTESMTDNRHRVSLHLQRRNSDRINVAVTDLKSKKEVGPSFMIRHLVWETET
ncbi:hypothetical protein [[Eubacterium] cellulosolvens]